ncbi:apiosidase-like domain-containing protein [Flavobacterium sp. ARAG 55.4]|uniref:apiosidase-like domain-containing protein n=1 Tax=Flavobacterium sp. ARAG 55.4 TaxID=3451357 RepID=UPI003F45F9B6
MNTKLCLLLFVFTIRLNYAQTKVWNKPKSNQTIATVQWEVSDLVYHSSQKIEKPLEKEVFALVKGNNETQKIPLFYNGNNDWVFRFSSSTVGNKNFVIQSDIKELNGKKGKFTIQPNKKVDRHGGIVLHKDNPQHFFYEDGSHYFNLAFECDWLFALDYGQKEIPKTKQLLSTIAENRFNQIVMNVYAYDLDLDWVKDEKLKTNPQHNYGAREDIFPFLGSNSNPDYSALNIDFFKHFDKVIAAMHDQEIVSHLMIYVWNKRVAWPKAGSDADNRYYNYVIKRYQAFPNVIWDVSKEATNKIALEQNKNVVQHIEERISRTRNLDAFDRLVSVHDFGFCKNHKNEVDFISTQDWKLSLHESMLNVYKLFPDKPVFNIEHGGYEESPYNIFPGGFSNAEACLRRNYLCLFAGVYTTYYWQAAAWNAIIHNPFEQPEAVIKPRFDYFKYMRNLFDKVNFENFVPDSKKMTRSYVLANAKEGVVMQYLPKEVHSDDMKQYLENEYNYEKATWQWFNTLTGAFTEEKKVLFEHKYGFWDWRPWRNEADAILIIKGLKQL